MTHPVHTGEANRDNGLIGVMNGPIEAANLKGIPVAPN